MKPHDALDIPIPSIIIPPPSFLHLLSPSTFHTTSQLHHLRTLPSPNGLCHPYLPHIGLDKTFQTFASP
ncbi:hypothetical protein BDW67DRAFT_84885 [Aspergillus spinulosporus]